jgi:hypothetical protein
MMFQDLRKLQPFNTKKGRYHHNFKEIVVSPTSLVNMSISKMAMDCHPPTSF